MPRTYAAQAGPSRRPAAPDPPSEEEEEDEDDDGENDERPAEPDQTQGGLSDAVRFCDSLVGCEMES